MIIEFRVANYLSIKDEQILSFAASSEHELEETHTIKLDKYKIKILRTAAIFGPNASGKTNMLKAINFMKNFIINSAKNKPGETTYAVPFKFTDGKYNILTKFEATFLLDDDIMYTYGFKLDEKKVYEEWLFYYPKKYKKTLFTRKNMEYKFSSDFRGENKSISKMTRENSLFLSAAADKNNKIAMSVYGWFMNNIFNFNQTDIISNALFHKNILDYYKKQNTKNEVIKLLNNADLNITDFTIKSKKLGEEFAPLLNFLTGQGITINNNKEAIDFNNETIDELIFKHDYNGISAELKEMEESNGTQKLFYILPVFIDFKGIILIDEIESSMHPYVINSLLDYFYKNNIATQLIFTSHNTDLLNTELFRRDEIWFTEKETSGNTIIFSLNDIKPKPRLDDNIKMRYLYGKYGAIPNI